MPHWGDATLLEAAWTWMALLGVGLSARLAWLMNRSIDRLLRSGINGLRVDVAQTRHRTQIGRLWVFCGFAVIGLLALFAPEPLRRENQSDAVIGGVVLVAVQARMLYDSIKDNVDRERQLGLVAQQEERILDATNAFTEGFRTPERGVPGEVLGEQTER